MRLRLRKDPTPAALSAHATLVYNALLSQGWISSKAFHHLTNGNEMVKAELKSKGLIIETVDGDVLAKKTIQERAA
jgi:hypothetical protein